MSANIKGKCCKRKRVASLPVDRDSLTVSEPQMHSLLTQVIPDARVEVTTK